MTKRANQRTIKIVAIIAAMPLAELRQEWERRYGAAPLHRSAELLRRVLAWRVQADALGGLSAVTRKLLDGTKPLPKTLSSPRPKPGQRLAREFAGRIHEVTVMADHVLYEGVRFGSLSEAARFITGKRWNGPRFFGLRERSRP